MRRKEKKEERRTKEKERKKRKEKKRKEKKRKEKKRKEKKMHLDRRGAIKSRGNDCFHQSWFDVFQIMERLSNLDFFLGRIVGVMLDSNSHI